MHQYYPIFIVLVFPLIYKILYWNQAFAQKDNQQSFRVFFKEKSYSFWIFMDIALAAWALLVFINPLYEVFLYNIYFYYFLLYNIFVFGKIFRRRIHIKFSAKDFLIFIFLLGGIIWTNYLYFSALYIAIFASFMLNIITFLIIYLCLKK